MDLTIKICGLKEEGTIVTAVEQGADYIGLVFFDKSPRNVSIARARELRQFVGQQAKVVAVTVDPTDAILLQIVSEVKPDFLQLHGNESLARVNEIKARFALPIIKACPIRDSGDIEAALSYQPHVESLLFDAKPLEHAALPGGNGIVFDWSLLAPLKGKVDYILSGGLNAANIAKALDITNAKTIDVSSGVEISPGIKDKNLIEKFFAAVHEIGAKERK